MANKKSVFFLIILSLLSLKAISQKISLPEIRDKVTNQDSPQYYPELKAAFLRDDSLGLQDYICIYYGFLYQKEYNVLHANTTETRIRQLNFTKDFEKAIQLADSLLIKYPVSLQAIFERSFASFMTNRKEEEAIYNFRYQSLIKAILSNYSGESPDDAIVVLSPTDEYEILRFMDLKVKNHYEIEYKGSTVDVFELKKNKNKISVIYFDTSAYSRNNP